MRERRIEEITLVGDRYGPIEYPDDVSYVLFPEYRLTVGRNRDVTELLVNLPPGYPEVAPDCFFVAEGLRQADGGDIADYSEGVEHLGRKWGQFSIHPEQSEWRPSADVTKGHNLQTFMLIVEQRLQEPD